MKRLEHRERRVPQPRQHVCQPVGNNDAVCAAKTGCSQFVTHHHCVERELQVIAIPSAAAAAAAVIFNICSSSCLRIEMRNTASERIQLIWEVYVQPRRCVMSLSFNRSLHVQCWKRLEDHAKQGVACGFCMSLTPTTHIKQQQ